MISESVISESVVMGEDEESSDEGIGLTVLVCSDSSPPSSTSPSTDSVSVDTVLVDLVSVDTVLVDSLSSDSISSDSITSESTFTSLVGIALVLFTNLLTFSLSTSGIATSFNHSQNAYYLQHPLDLLNLLASAHTSTSTQSPHPSP